MKQAIRAKALELGFDAVGFASAVADPSWRAALDRYVAEGRHGGMAWMAERMDHRTDPAALWAEVRSVVVLGLNYAPPATPWPDWPMAERGTSARLCRGKVTTTWSRSA